MTDRVDSIRKYRADVPPSWSSVWTVFRVLVTFRRYPMNRVLVAGIAGLAMLLTASSSYAGGFGRKCGGDTSCGGLLSNLGSRCREPRPTCGGGLLAKLKERKASCCGEPAPVCCEPVSTCAPSCAPVVESCGGCAPAVSSGCNSCGGSVMSYDSGMMSYGSGVVISGCSNCSQTMDGGMIMESSSPSMAPPAPAPVADPAADAVPSASDAPAAPAA